MQLMFIQAHGSLAFTMESERSPIPTFTRAEKHHKLWTPFPIFAVLTTLVAPLFVTTSFDEDSNTFPIQGIYLLSLTIWEGAWYFTRRDRAQFEDEGCYALCSR
ncbi:hypothetical protein BGW80DRAFT_1368969 [Lactifluus volemus]|nr:hypothetical protein BGW80DRAFT_1368969 [Lactifluus volemus]